MSVDSSKSLKGSPAEVIDAVYEGALEPGEYIQLFEAWDRFFLDPATQREDDSDRQLPRGAELESHFRRAARIFEQTLQTETNGLQAVIDEMKYAAFGIDGSGAIVLHNQSAQNLFLDRGVKSLFDYVINADAETRLKAFLRDHQVKNTVSDLQLCLTGEHPKTKQNLVFVIEPVADEESSALALVKTSSVSWNDENERLLKSAFGFTQAEIEITKSMVNGYSLSDITEQRGRSLSTIRTQIKMMLQKTGLGSQKELLRLVTSICFILDERASDSADREVDIQSSSSSLKSIELKNGRSLPYVVTGTQNGTPVLFLQPTTRPDFTQRLQAAFAAQNLKVISPVRPGSWGTSPLSKGEGFDQQIDDYAMLIERLGLDIRTIVGYCSGGIYAAKLAARLGSRVKRVCLIDTGAPLDKVAKIRSMPRTERRTFLTARLFPSVLLVPHRLIAADFRRSTRGEEKTVSYFYADSPHDRALIKQKEYYQITRDNIAYCFENVPQLVSDVILWAQDWTELLNDITKTAQVQFIMGANNNMFAPNDVRQLEAQNSNVQCRIVDDAGQTLIYEHSEAVAALIAE
ncbi:MAG: alpha/beta hydrolase [Pseudomonadota bacterium]